ncbi:hypothetical protein HanIR_Chr09g0418991 [Helianthus annuus]|nr:hypothetical protein HanIR_Chr09g0418991 [Helianthus annuus]
MYVFSVASRGYLLVCVHVYIHRPGFVGWAARADAKAQKVYRAQQKFRVKIF